MVLFQLYGVVPLGHLQSLDEEKRRKLCICDTVCQAGPTLLIVAVYIFGRLRFGFVSYHLFKQLFNLEARSGAFQSLNLVPLHRETRRQD